MDDFDCEREESAIAESKSLYSSCVPNLEGAEETLHYLLKRKQELKSQYLAACEEKLILNELLKEPGTWTTVRDAERKKCEMEELANESEMNAVLNERMDQMMVDVEAATQVFDTWRSNMDMLSQKIEMLKTKKQELEGFDLIEGSLSLHHIEVKNKQKQVNVLLEAAVAEQEILRERLARMKDSLEYLLERQAQLERKQSLQKIQLHSLNQALEDMQKLSGIECQIIDETRVQITIQPRQLLNVTGIVSESDQACLGDCKFTAELIFGVNDEGCLEISDVQTEHNVEEVQKLIAQVKQNKDLPSFILGLQNTWLSYLPLNMEVSCLRKKFFALPRSHAIDFRQDLGVLQLIINKKSIVCSLNVPKSYPRADVSLASITGHPELTADDISEPPTKSLTAWVRHLEDLLGQKQ